MGAPPSFTVGMVFGIVGMADAYLKRSKFLAHGRGSPSFTYPHGLIGDQALQMWHAQPNCEEEGDPLA